MGLLELLFGLVAMILYVVLACFLVSNVGKYTKKQIYKWLIVIFVILLPTWDVLLGKIVYSIACRYFAKVAVYETAETDGIYYEGINNYIFDFDKQSTEPFSERIYIGSTRWILKEGYEYTESKVVEEHDLANRQIAIDPSYYRCSERSSEKESMPGTVFTNCVEINKPVSPYLVKVITIPAGTAKMYFKKIINRSNGSILGEYNQVVAVKVLPFFYWLYKTNGTPETIRCPVDENSEFPNSKFNTFEYRVLRPKNKQTGE